MTHDELRAFLDGLTVEESQHMLAYLKGAAPKEFSWAVGRVRKDRAERSAVSA